MSDNYIDNHYESTSKETVSLLNRAQRLYDEHINSAEERKDEIVSAAKTEAEDIVSDAYDKARSIVEEAEQTALMLEEKIEKLKGLEYNYRLRLKDAADSTIESLESMSENNDNETSYDYEEEDTPTFDFLKDSSISYSQE